MYTIEQQDYEQRFNDCCANIIGLKKDIGCTDPIYVRDDGMRGTYECKIEDYVPYTSLDQLEKVAEILKSTLGYTVDLEAQRRDGVLATYRLMVDNILFAVDDCGDHPYETCAEREEAKETAWCRSTDTEEDKEALLGVDKLIHQPYEACAEQMEEVEKATFDPDKERGEARESFENAMLFADTMQNWSNTDEDILDVEEGWDEYNKNHSKPHPMYDDDLQGALEENTKRQFEHSLQLNIKYNNTGVVTKEEIVAGAQRVIEFIDGQTPDTTTHEDIFNIRCAGFMGYETMYNNLGHGSVLVCAGTRDGWDNPEQYEPYNNFGQLEEVVEELLEREDGRNHTGQHFIAVAECRGDGEQERMGLYRGIVSSRLINNEDLQEVFDEPNNPPEDEERKMNDFTHIGNPRSVDWQAARFLLLAEHRGYDVMYVDGKGKYHIGEHNSKSRNEIVQFNELTEEGLLQAYQIEDYVRNPNNCMEEMWVYASTETTYNLPFVGDANLERVHLHRLKIINGVLEKLAEEYTTEENAFNELCQRITKTVMKTGYVIDTSTFNPYQDMLQLSRIVETVIVATFEPFVISIEGSGGNIDVMEEMQKYVEVYSTEKYMTLEEL